MHHESLEPRRLLSATALHAAATRAVPTVQLPGTITTANLGAGSTFRAGNNSLSGGSFAGWSTVGSIANYLVNSAGGTFSDTLRYATDTNGDAIQVQVDGQNVGSPVSLPSTGGWYNWKRANLPQISLSSGGHTVSLLVTGGDPSVNIQKWNFTSVSTVPPPPTPPPPPPVGSVTGLELFDGATQTDLGPITAGETITETSGQTFAIRAAASGAIGSVLFNLDSGTYTATDNSAPYDVFGTAADGSSTPATVGVGSHTISATPYASANDQGSAGTAYTVAFSIVQQTPPPTPPPPVVPPPPPPPPAVPPPPPPTPTGSVTGLELLDGTTQQDLGPITQGEVITEAQGQTFAIRTNTAGTIGSVLYNLDSGTYTHTENAVPYDVFGTAADGSSIPETLGVGSHTLSATPYSSANDQGTAGSVYTIDFSVAQQTPPPTPPPPVVPPPPPPPPAVPPPPPPTPTGSVTGLELFDGATQQDLGPITEGQTITEAQGQTFAIRASSSGAIGSVLFNLDNGVYTNTDNTAPFDVFGTAANGTSTPNTLSVGSHTVSATPFASANDQGNAGTPVTVDFSVAQQTPPPVPPPPVVPPPPPPPPVVPPPPPPPPAVPPPPPPSSGSAPIPGTWTQAFDTNFATMSGLGPWTPNNFWGVSGLGAAGQEIDVPGNAVIANGVLNLYARKQSDGSWTGGEVTTGGLEGSSSLPVFNFTYGYAQATMKFPAGVGGWPAFWMLPYSSHGEVDVNETLDEQPTQYYATVHLSGQTQHTVKPGVDLTAGFHTYGVDWEPSGLTFYFDGQPVWTETSMIPTEAENLLLDMGVSDGSWGVAPDSSTPSVMDMQVSDVQVWQHPAGTAAVVTNAPAINAGSSLTPTTSPSGTSSNTSIMGTSSSPSSTPAFDALSSGSNSTQQNKVL